MWPLYTLICLYPCCARLGWATSVCKSRKMPIHRVTLPKNQNWEHRKGLKPPTFYGLQPLKTPKLTPKCPYWTPSPCGVPLGGCPPSTPMAPLKGEGPSIPKGGGLETCLCAPDVAPFSSASRSLFCWCPPDVAPFSHAPLLQRLVVVPP